MLLRGFANMITTHRRRETIDEVLRELAAFKPDFRPENHYAVEANREFFEAIKSRSKYFRWLTMRARKLAGDRLLEINDLLPQWDAEMHRELIAMERKKFPGLLKPIVGRLAELVMSGGSSPFVAANLGCGGMEIERQTIAALRSASYRGKIVFVGIDQSPIAHAIAKENLRTMDLPVDIQDVENLDGARLESFVHSFKDQYAVILCKNDIFKLKKVFDGKTFNVAFHSLFKHHLAAAERSQLDSILADIAHCTLEYDGYKSWPMMIPQSITVWRHPILLNATIFSDLRYATKKELRQVAGRHRLAFTKIGTYLLEKHH